MYSFLLSILVFVVNILIKNFKKVNKIVLYRYREVPQLGLERDADSGFLVETDPLFEYRRGGEAFFEEALPLAFEGVGGEQRLAKSSRTIRF